MLTEQARERAVLLAGTSVPKLAQRVADKLGLALSPAIVGRFSDGEARIQIDPNVPLRDRTVFIIQSTYAPADYWVEVLLLADAARRAAAHHVIWVAPFIGYGRQDRKIDGHDPISAAVMLELTRQSGVTQIISVDLHSDQSQGMVPIPFSHLWGRKYLLKGIFQMEGLNPKNPRQMRSVAIVAPDAGSYKVAAHYAERYGCMLVACHKGRSRPNGRPVIALLDGKKARGRTCIILDDMGDTCGTAEEATDKIRERKPEKVILAVTHPVFSGRAKELIKKPSLDMVVVTDTIPLRLRPVPRKVKVVSVADDLANAIRLVLEGGIVSSLTKTIVTD